LSAFFIKLTRELSYVLCW